ncbi:hypothetical protein B0H10DRAFT_2442023 [Mycena sp. CBHHK59/15]|nr:hypothetical protein B0H10DRAFT_2442023 [Mycena sp. CBHHK59/15]
MKSKYVWEGTKRPASLVYSANIKCMAALMWTSCSWRDSLIFVYASRMWRYRQAKNAAGILERRGIGFLGLRKDGNCTHEIVHEFDILSVIGIEMFVDMLCTMPAIAKKVLFDQFPQKNHAIDGGSKETDERVSKAFEYVFYRKISEFLEQGTIAVNLAVEETTADMFCLCICGIACSLEQDSLVIS